MSNYFRTKAIVLKQRGDLRESDRFFALYSPEKGRFFGRLTGGGKVLNKLIGHLSPLNVCEVVLAQGQQNNQIVGAYNLRCFSKIKKDYHKIYWAIYCAETVDNFARNNIADKEVYHLLENFLHILDELNVGETGGRGQFLASVFLLKLTDYFGFTPALEHCVRCHINISAVGDLFFNLQDGGVLCEKCVKNTDLKLSANVFKMLRFCLNSELKECLKLKFSLIDGEEFNKIAQNYLNFHLK